MSRTHLLVRGDHFLTFFRNIMKYHVIQEITFEFVFIENLIYSNNLQKLQKLKNLRALNFKHNNLKNYIDLIEFENQQFLSRLSIAHNPITDCYLLRYFVFYRFSNLSHFNGSAKTQKEVQTTKSIYYKFDRSLQEESVFNFDEGEGEGLEIWRSVAEMGCEMYEVET